MRLPSAADDDGENRENENDATCGDGVFPDLFDFLLECSRCPGTPKSALRRSTLFVYDGKSARKKPSVFGPAKKPIDGLFIRRVAVFKRFSGFGSCLSFSAANSPVVNSELYRIKASCDGAFVQHPVQKGEIIVAAPGYRAIGTDRSPFKVFAPMHDSLFEERERVGGPEVPKCLQSTP